MKKLFFLLASMLFIVSCTTIEEELTIPFQLGQEVTLNAAINSIGDISTGPQRISGLDSNPGSSSGVINLTWDAGDQIEVTVGGQSSIFTLSSGAGCPNASFIGTMPADGKTYHVTYPANYNENMLTTQAYVPNGFDKGLMKMSTKTNGTIDRGFSMSADNGLLGLSLKGDSELGKIVLTNPANTKTYTLNCSDVTLTEHSTLFYIVVPSGTWEKGFTIDVYASDNSTKIKTLTKTDRAVFSAIHAMTMPTQDVIGGMLSQGEGAFSVSETKKVVFSHGNLQYHPLNETWRFAPNQYDYIGLENENISTTYNGWIDMFGWSSDANPATKWGVSSFVAYNQYSGNFVDWGTNIILAYPINTWRTLTSEEWNYLLNNRNHASSLIGVAKVDDVIGLVLLPDDWTCPLGVSFKSGFLNDVTYQTYTIDQWLKLENAGAVFLPAYGRRRGINIMFEQDGLYWSSTKMDSFNAHCMIFYYGEAYVGGMNYHFGLFVRLVKDVQ